MDRIVSKVTSLVSRTLPQLLKNRRRTRRTWRMRMTYMGIWPSVNEQIVESVSGKYSRQELASQFEHAACHPHVAVLLPGSYEEAVVSNNTPHGKAPQPAAALVVAAPAPAAAPPAHVRTPLYIPSPWTNAHQCEPASRRMLLAHCNTI
eukprot:8446687-Pyramimonas_sp.AAC.1